MIDDIIGHLQAGRRRVYLSNDIDATDAGRRRRRARPSPKGLRPAFVHALIAGVGAAFPLLGADVVEVAPPIGPADDARRTAEVAAGYMLESLAALADAPTRFSYGSATASVSRHEPRQRT